MKNKISCQCAPARGSLAPARSFIRRRLGEGGFFNLRLLIGLVFVLLSSFLALIGSGGISKGFGEIRESTSSRQTATAEDDEETLSKELVEHYHHEIDEYGKCARSTRPRPTEY